MTQSNKKQVLLCITGLSPQVVTETLYGIHKNNEANPAQQFWPEEIHIITTSKGKTQAKLGLITPKEKGEQSVLAHFCQDYNRPLPILTEDFIHVVPDAQGNLVDDARTKEDQDALADFIVKAVAQLCREIPEKESRREIQLHASIAGGRKTMTFYLGYAMTLFARPDDVLSHVLVDQNYEGLREFYYPTPETYLVNGRNSNEQFDAKEATVMLAEIPFIRQRDTMDKHVLSEFSNSDVLNLNAKKTDFDMSYSDLVMYQNIIQLLTLKEVALSSAKSQYDVIEKKLEKEKRGKANNEQVLYANLDQTNNKIFTARQELQEMLAKFELTFNLPEKNITLTYGDVFCKTIDFSNNDLEFAYYMMIARQSDKNKQKILTLVLGDGSYKFDEIKQKNVRFIQSYLFVLELLRIKGVSEDKISKINEDFDLEDAPSVFDCLPKIFNNKNYCQYLDVYKKTIKSFYDYEVDSDSHFIIDEISIENHGAKKKFFADHKNKLIALLNKSLPEEVNNVISPTGVWQQDVEAQLITKADYYIGRSNPHYLDGLWIKTNLTD